jgi:alpha-amylase/alpha-mannosidase (GH57 family)
MTYFNFNSRETYIAAAAQWKADYKDLSQKIRDVRKQFNDAQKVFAKSSTREGTYWPAWKEVERLRSERDGLRNQATYMIDGRISMKAQAQEQYEASQ